MSDQKRPAGLIVLSVINLITALSSIAGTVTVIVWQLRHDSGISVYHLSFSLIGIILLIVSGIGMFKVNYKLGFITGNIYGIYFLSTMILGLILHKNARILLNPYIIYSITLLLLLNLRYKKYFYLNKPIPDKPVTEVKKMTPVIQPAEKIKTDEGVLSDKPHKTTYILAGRLLRIVGWIQIVMTVSILLAVIMPLTQRGFDKADMLAVFIPIGFVLTAIAFLVFQLYAAKAIMQHKQWGKTAGMALGIFYLFGFPLGTILGGFILYYLKSGWE